MDLEEGIKELNKKIEIYNKSQEDLQKKVLEIEKEKKGIYSDYIKSIVDKDFNKLNELREKSLKMTGDNSLGSLKLSLFKLYDIAFHGIITKKLQTDIKLPDIIKSDLGSDDGYLWINSRGLAIKPDRWNWKYNWKKPDKTVCIRDDKLSSLIYIITKYPEIEDYIEKDEKKKIFIAFNKFCKNLKDFESDRQLFKRRYNIVSKEIKDNRGYLYDTYILKNLNIKNYTVLEVTIRDNLVFNFNTGNAWGNNYIRLNGDLKDLDKVLLSQIPDYILDEVDNGLDNIKIKQDKNIELYNKLREDIAPYIMHRMV